MLERAIPDFRPAFASDNYLVLKSALAAGLGVMVLERQSSTLARGDDRLVELDLGFSLPESEYHLICAKSMRFVPRVRAVAELLVQHLCDARLA
jgi:DNA-binding transcriptional LysR family regulator